MAFGRVTWRSFWLVIARELLFAALNHFFAVLAAALKAAAVGAPLVPGFLMRS
jgi:hypothetical protein